MAGCVVHRFDFFLHAPQTFLQANSDVSNFITMAAIYGGVVGPANDRHVRVELTFNTDKTSLFLQRQQEGIVVTLEGLEYLAAHHLNAAHTHADSQARGLAVIPTICADGSCLCILVCIRDDRYTAASLTVVSALYDLPFWIFLLILILFQLDRDRNIFLWTGNKSREHAAHLNRTLVEDVVFPCMVAKRKKLLAHDSSDEDGPPEDLAAAEARERAEPMVLLIDGEHDHLVAMENHLNRPLEALGLALNIHVIKLPAACSKTEQPADVSRCFSVLKQLGHSYHLHAPKTVPKYLHRLETSTLVPIPAASRATYLEYFRHFDVFVGAAFSEANINKGWSVAGLDPLNYLALMSQCTDWSSLSAKERGAVLAAIPKLIPLAISAGQLSTSQIQAAVGPDLDLTSAGQLDGADDGGARKRKRQLKPLEQRPINHRRAMLLTCSAIWTERVAGGAGAAAAHPSAPPLPSGAQPPSSATPSAALSAAPAEQSNTTTTHADPPSSPPTTVGRPQRLAKSKANAAMQRAASPKSSEESEYSVGDEASEGGESSEDDR